MLNFFFFFLFKTLLLRTHGMTNWFLNFCLGFLNQWVAIQILLSGSVNFQLSSPRQNSNWVRIAWVKELWILVYEKLIVTLRFFYPFHLQERVRYLQYWEILLRYDSRIVITVGTLIWQSIRVKNACIPS